MKSKVYKLDGKMFRYNFDRNTVEYVAKAGNEELKDEAEWMQKYGEPLFGIDHDGYMVIDSIGLSREKNFYITNIVKCRPPRNRDPLNTEQDACIGYLWDQMALAADFVKYELPYLV